MHMTKNNPEMLRSHNDKHSNVMHKSSVRPLYAAKGSGVNYHQMKRK